MGHSPHDAIGLVDHKMKNRKGPNSPRILISSMIVAARRHSSGLAHLSASISKSYGRKSG